MGENSGIEWTNHTWNPFVGCIKVSQGCKHCYMYRDQERYGNDPRAIRRTSDATFYKPKTWHDPARVFTCSWSDFFLEEVDGWRDDAWGVIRDTPHLTYQILTKRPERIQVCLPDDWREGWPNVWLGTSIESNDVMGRAADLVRNPAAVHFVSFEPLLGPVWDWFRLRDIEWVIVGGESGPAARPMNERWALDIIRWCERESIPVFFKQWGGWPDKRGGDKAVIDGRTWRQFPDVPADGPARRAARAAALLAGPHGAVDRGVVPMTVTLWLPEHRPMSRNRYDRAHWAKRTAEKHRVQWAVRAALGECLSPNPGDWPVFDQPVEISMTVHYAGRQFDTLNCNSKIYEDALQNQIIKDDGPSHVVGWHIYSRPVDERGPGVEIIVKETTEDD